MRVRLLLAAVAVLGFARSAHADAPPTWGVPNAEESVVRHARELVERAKFLEEVASGDEKAAIEIERRIETLRPATKAANERASRSKETDKDHDALVAKAEELEADLVVSEAEATAKRRSSVENRRFARELRAAAVRLVREAPTELTASLCNPPFRYAASGHKIYRIECLDRAR